MASTSPKKIAVVGGTASDKAKPLSRAGIEVVKADAWKRDELLKAFEGCWGVFVNIDSDAPNFKEQIGLSEYEMGKIVIDSAVEAGIGHAVHASLPAATKLTDGKVSVLAFDVTGKPTRFKELPLGGLTAANPPKTKKVNLLYDLMHALEGNFFNGVPTNHENARILKAEAAKARKSGAVDTTTVEEFWKKYAC